MATIWYDRFKQQFEGWNGVNGFELYFLAQFASPIMRKTWYTEYKNMKQNGQTVDEYTTEFLIKWQKIDQNQAILMESVMNDLINRFDPYIKMGIYPLMPTNVTDAIAKVKMIEVEQKSVAIQLEAYAKMAQLEQENLAYRLQLQINNSQQTDTEVSQNK